MIFLTGPRQVGKTHLARRLSKDYFNWDTSEVKKAFLRDPYFFRTTDGTGESSRLVIFDEIHKRKDWKKLLKGYYDSSHRTENFLVTGSGRFDQYLRGGDSLQGRYNGYQLWPFSPAEVASGTRGLKPALPREWSTWHPEGRDATHTEANSNLLRLGGFPAPFISQSEAGLRRWQDQYLDRLVREDVRDFSAVQRVDQMEMLARILPERSTSPLSIQGLSEDLDVSHVAVKSWLRLFETLYFGFMVRPYHRKIHRAVKKEAKWYFYQWTYSSDPGARFENYLAVQLGSACSKWSESGFGRYELWYLRDQDRREIDFLITLDLKPVALIEAKSAPQPWTAALHYYTQKLKIPGFLVYPEGPVRAEPDNRGFSVPVDRFLKSL